MCPPCPNSPKFPHTPQVNLEGFALPVKKLKGTNPVETLDLSRKRLGFLSAIVIAALIKVNGEPLTNFYY